MISMKGFKTFLIGLAGFVSIVLTAFFFNINMGVLLFTIVIFSFIHPTVSFIHSNKSTDSYVDDTVSNIEATPEIIEHLEEKVHDVIDFTKEKVSKTWKQYTTEAESIACELTDFMHSK